MSDTTPVVDDFDEDTPVENVGTTEFVDSESDDIEGAAV